MHSPIFGIEGFSERLRKFIKKQINNKDILEITKILKSLNKKKMTFFMMHGFPSECSADRIEFINMIFDIPEFILLEMHFTPLMKNAHTPLSFFKIKYNHDSRKFIEYIKKKLPIKAKKLIYPGKLEPLHVLDTILACGNRGVSSLIKDHGKKLLNYKLEKILYLSKKYHCCYNQISDEWPEKKFLPWGYIDFRSKNIDVYEEYLKLKKSL